MPLRDSTQARVQTLVGELVAIGYSRAPLSIRVCACGCEDGTHHGPDGDLHCSECPCPAFRLAETFEVDP